MIYIDFQKAFDCVNHEILSYKLRASGLSGALHDWIIDYLSNRKQFVKVNGVSSNLMDIDTGVPQGSLLGPRLYSIYSNNLSSYSTNANVEMFADDTTAFIIGDSVDEVLFCIQKSIIDLDNSAKSNCMTIHPAKTELMLLSRSNFIGPLQNISLGPNQLNFVTKSTSLGVQIDNKLAWSYHIKSLCKRFRARLKKLKHLKGLDNNTLETIYFKGILPSVTYSISVWGSSNSLHALEDIHIRAARFIHNITDSIPKVGVLDKAKWQPISYIYKKRMACIAYQAYYNQAPDSINNLFIKHCPPRSLRDNLKFEIQRPNSNFRRDSISHRACNLWNNLPVSIKNKPNLGSFKSALRNQSKAINKIFFNGTVGTNKDIDTFLY